MSSSSPQQSPAAFPSRVVALVALLYVVSLAVVCLTGWATVEIAVLTWAAFASLGIVSHKFGNVLLKNNLLQHQFALSMMIRSGGPMLIAMVVYTFKQSWFDQGFLTALLVFYFVSLVCDVILTVATFRSLENSDKMASDSRGSVL